MPLAAILGVSLLLALPSSGEALPTAATLEAQSAQSQQDSPRADSPQQNPAAPAESGKDSTSSGSQSQTSSGPASSAQQTPTPANAEQQAEGSKASQSAPKSAVHPKKKHHRKHRQKAPPVTTPKVVVPNGGTSDPSVQLAPSLTKQQAANQRQNTDQLLASTESNLKAIAGRRLQASQQDTVKQIEQYVAQAKGAAKTGDLERAHNLALKAQLLSEELVKH
jgi:hypothetical protein